MRVSRPLAAIAGLLFFRSGEHVDRWCRQWNLSKGALLSLEQGWRLAQTWYGPDRREPEWRRKTAGEAEALF